MNWLVLTLGILAVLLLAGLLLRRRLPRVSAAVLIVLAVYAAVMLVGTAICWDEPQQPDAPVDYAVVLGYALRDGQPTQELTDRLQAAKAWLEETEQIPLVVTGGDPAGHGITEAAVMYQWLADHGADMNRVLQEDRASDTRENFLHSKALVQSAGVDGTRVMILTSDYHQTRAVFWAKQLGLEPVCRSSETAFFRHLEASVREVYAFAKALMEAAA